MPPLPNFASPPLRSSLRLLSILPLFAVIDPAFAQIAVPSTTESPVCPVGVVRCIRPKDDYAKCKRNDLLDFFTAGLPPAGDRSKAPSTAVANKVTRVDDTHNQFEGNVEMQRLDALLKSDFITFDTETTDYVANGHVRYQDAGMLMSAERARGTTQPSTTHLETVRYQMLDQRGNGIAATVNQSDPDHSEMLNGTYSTCDPSERQWEMRSDNMQIDRVNNEAYGQGVTIAYEGMPFLWLPYMSWPIDEDRHSGFLIPQMGYTTRRGLKLGIPYYFDLAPNYDATLTPIDYSKRGPMLGGEVRYISDWDHLQLNFSYLPDDQVTNTSRGDLRVQDWITFSPYWSGTVDLHHVSDDHYLQDFGDNFQTTAISLLPSSVGVGTHGDWWNMGIGADTWEVTDPTLETICPANGGTTHAELRDCANPTVYKPYTRLPHVSFNAYKTVGGFEFGMTSEYTNFERAYSVNGQRVDIYPYVAYPIEAAGYFLRPQVGYRYTQYDLSNLYYEGTQTLSHTSTRALPIVSVDSGLIFERSMQLFNTQLTQTLEPRLFYLYVPYRNQNNLPNFDTSLPSFDFPSLFRTNAYTGSDRQINANNLTAALTTRLIDAESGDQFLSASIGQIQYFERERVPLAGAPSINQVGKDIVAELDLRLGKNWDFTWDQQWNPNRRSLLVDSLTGQPIVNSSYPNVLEYEGHNTDLSAIGVQRRFGAEGVINVDYRFRRGLLEQIDTSTLVPINSRWSLIGRYYYSLMDKRVLETFAGFQYDSCCIAARALVRRYLDNISGANVAASTVKTDTAFYLELEFKGIGATGQRAENYLRKTILGHP